jgi:signal transduction histidine kinase
MAAIIERVLRQLDQHLAERQAVIQAQTDWPVVMGYAPWIERVWFNYLTNGLKYGGEPPCLEIGADAGTGPMIRFWVRDNGAGIEDDDRQSIFKPFTRYHSRGIEGHGIGLSIVQRIITKLGGDVGVCSLPDGGSEFYFTLPRL